MNPHLKIISVFLMTWYLPLLLAAQDEGKLILVQSNSTVLEYSTEEESARLVGSLTDPNMPSQLFFSHDKWWCVSTDGGKYDQGVLFTLDVDGTNLNEIWSFESPFVGVLINDNKLWGYSVNEGNHGNGFLGYYDFDESDFYVVHHFEEINGSKPSSLIWVENKLWGTTTEGLGIEVNQSDGTVFTYDPETAAFEVVYRFADDGLGTGPSQLVYNGSRIFGTFIKPSPYPRALFSLSKEGTDFKIDYTFNTALIYGRPNHMINDDGNIVGVNGTDFFEYYASAATPFITAKEYFNNQETGEKAYSIISYDNSHYGITRDGGASDAGTIYSIKSNAITVEYSFSNDGSGSRPRAPFVVYDDQFYGFTSTLDEDAVMYRFNPATKAYSSLYTFDNKKGVNYGSIIEGEGAYYTVARSDGKFGHGSLVSIDAESYESEKLYDFDVEVSPEILYHNGKIYGVSTNGGDQSYGAIYLLDPVTKEFEWIYEFDFSNGRYPTGRLAVVQGRIWGVSNQRVYSLKADGTDYRTEQLLNGHLSSPGFGLFLHAGKVWGVCKSGGAYDKGGVFSIHLDDSAFDEVWSFSESLSYVNHRPYLYRGLLFMTHEGSALYGRSNAITKFDLDAKSLTLVYSFKGKSVYDVSTGVIPFRGRLWGTTDRGAERYSGVLYSLDLSGEDFKTHHSFNDEVKASPNQLPIIIGADVMNPEATLNDIPTLTYGDPAFDVRLNSLNSSEVKVNADNNEIISISGTTAIIKGTGEVLLTISQDADEYYESVSIQKSIYVNKKVLKVTGPDLTITYGDEIPSVELNYDGFVNDENSDDIGGGLSTSTTARQGSSTGTYDLEINERSLDNYSLTLSSGSITIAKAPLIISATDMTILTATSIPELLMEYQGFVNGDTADDIVPPSISTNATTDSGEGIYPITLSGGESQNYEMTLVNGTLTISYVLDVARQVYETWSIYPNPANKSFRILNDAPIDDLHIYATSGQLLHSFNSKNVNYDISNLQSGSYFVRLRSKDQVRVIHLVKK